MTEQDRLIVALDFKSGREALELATRLRPEVSWFKIGLELFSSEGPGLVRDFRYRWPEGHIFLDLKLHDIPETVARATERLAQLGADLLTVHASGGRAMLEAAVGAAAGTKILAVTALTSLDQEDLAEIGITETLPELVVRRARLAVQAGCAGVVASPLEAAMIRKIVPAGFLVVTPGVRPAGADTVDQKRVMTPREARVAGADKIVVGRPIRDAADPGAVVRAILAELASA